MVRRAATPGPAIEFFDFASGRLKRLASLEKEQAAPGAGGSSISPDGQWIIYSRVDEVDNDIMLVENFR